jgi:hypothetical protein
MQVVGREEINGMNIGYRIYSKLIRECLERGFKEFEFKKKTLRGSRSSWRASGNSEEDELGNVEERMEICEKRREMLKSAVALAEEERRLMRNILTKNTEGEELLNERASEKLTS